jgi:acetolactate synthase-1/3 small subunit
MAETTFTIELTGPTSELDDYLDSLEKSSIIETVRTGALGIGRGDRILKI